MKILSIIALIIALLALAITVFQISELRKEQKQLAEDLLKLRKEISESRHHTSKNEEEWPKFHEVTGVLKHITGTRVIIDQDEKSGFMRAMIMSYDVENPEQLKALKEGDKLRLKLKETETNLTVVNIDRQ